MSNDRRKVKSVSFDLFDNKFHQNVGKVEIKFDENCKRLFGPENTCSIEQVIMYKLYGDGNFNLNNVKYIYEDNDLRLIESTNSKVIENIVRAIFRSEAFENVAANDWRFRMDKEDLKRVFVDTLNKEFDALLENIKDYYVCNTIMKDLFRVFILSEEKLYVYYLTPDYNGLLKESLHAFDESAILWVNHSSLKDLNIINIHTESNFLIDCYNFQFTYVDGDKKAEDFITELNNLVDINSKRK